MTDKDGITTLTDAQLEAMLERAAKHGAREALKEVGLGDDLAGADIREVRGLLTAWRETKRAIWMQVVKMGITLILGAMAIGLAVMTWNYNGGSR